MLKNIWKKIRQNNWLLMLLCCGVPLLLIIGLNSLFKGDGNYWTWLIVLLCPLAHILMMSGRAHDDTDKKEEKHSDKKNSKHSSGHSCH